MLFVLLTKEAPFPFKSPTAQRDAIVHCDYGFHSKRWDYISDEAKDLIESMLQYDPGDRITAEEALNHPWFQRFYDLHEKSPLARQTITTFTHEDDFQQSDDFQAFTAT
jgi:serine/threonine protein kinase